MQQTPKSPLSPPSRSVQQHFYQLILASAQLSSDAFTSAFSAHTKSEKLKNLLLASFRAIAPKLTAAHAFNAVVALDWMASSLSMRGMEYECLTIHGLDKHLNETYRVYVGRMRKLIETLHVRVSPTIIALLKSKYAENLTSPYLPTEYFGEFEDLDYDLLSVFYAIFTDPYPRSKAEWQERVNAANELYQDSIDIPSAKFIIKTNESPSITSPPSHAPFLTQVLSKGAVTRMVEHWGSDDFAAITNTMRNAPLTHALNMHGGFLHGMMQYIATESEIAQGGRRMLYRGMHIAGPSALEEFFPIDENGRRRALKDTSLIATSLNEEVAGNMYADRERSALSLSSPSRGLLMHITPCTGAPITYMAHTQGQDEALLLPGSFTFVKHLETKKTYDVIAVKYKPDFSIMKAFPGVWALWEARPKST